MRSLCLAHGHCVRRRLQQQQRRDHASAGKLAAGQHGQHDGQGLAQGLPVHLRGTAYFTERKVAAGGKGVHKGPLDIRLEAINSLSRSTAVLTLAYQQFYGRVPNCERAIQALWDKTATKSSFALRPGTFVFARPFTNFRRVNTGNLPLPTVDRLGSLIDPLAHFLVICPSYQGHRQSVAGCCGCMVHC